MSTLTVPEAVEAGLWAAAADVLPEGALEPRALVAAIVARSRRYTSEREAIAHVTSGMAGARDLAARALFFGVADLAKVALPLAELGERGALPSAPVWRVLDVGAGALAMSLGVAAACPAQPLDVLAVDRDGAALALGAAAFARAAPGSRVATRVLDAGAPAHLPAGPFDLIVAGTMVNELPEAARLPLLRALLGRLSDDGALIVVEPALRETSRALHALRDALLDGGGAHVIAPCTRVRTPCPALADARDWCHEDRPFQPPPRLRQLSAQTGLRDGGLKFAYLVVRRAPADLPLRPGSQALRVVSDALDAKGQITRILCGDDGRAPRTILKREKSPSRRVLARSRRGDVLERAADGALGWPGAAADAGGEAGDDDAPAPAPHDPAHEEPA